MATSSLVWDEAARQRLRTAVDLAGHGQEGCRRELHERRGAPLVRQSTISRWMIGTIQMPSCREAIGAYCDAHIPQAGIDDGLPHVKSAAKSGAGEVAGADDAADEQEASEAGFDEVSRLRAQLEVERARAARLARQVERLGRELASVLERP